MIHEIKLYPPGVTASSLSTSSATAKEPVVAETFDEVVFTNPKEIFFQQLQQVAILPPVSELYSQRDYFPRYSDHDTFQALLEAKRYLEKALFNVKNRLLKVDEDMEEVDAAIKIQLEKNKAAAAASAAVVASQINRASLSVAAMPNPAVGGGAGSVSSTLASTSGSIAKKAAPPVVPAAVSRPKVATKPAVGPASSRPKKSTIPGSAESSLAGPAAKRARPGGSRSSSPVPQAAKKLKPPTTATIPNVLPTNAASTNAEPPSKDGGMSTAVAPTAASVIESTSIALPTAAIGTGMPAPAVPVDGSTKVPSIPSSPTPGAAAPGSATTAPTESNKAG
jgi:hypothetical protein